MPLPTAPVVNDLSPERLRAVIASPPGGGKTTLAANWFPQTNLIIDLQGGTRFLPGAHFVERPADYNAFTALVNEIVAGGHSFKTVTIDTGDSLVRMADAAAGQRGGKVSAAEVEFGKGLGSRDGTIFRELGKLMATDLGVLFVTHSIKVTVKNEAGAERTVVYPRIEAGQEGDRLRQPILGEFDYIFHINKVSETERQLITGGHPGYETKRRYALPDVLPADANVLYQALVASTEQFRQAQQQAAAA